MKRLLLIIFLFSAFRVSAQRVIKTEKVTDHSTYVKGNNFEGVIFASSDIDYYYPKEQNYQKLYTPTSEDITLAEKILRQNIDTMKYYGSKNFILKNLKKYVRQYFGYINVKGEKIIYINALWKKSQEDQGKRWLKEQIGVLDGGDYYWQIKINLITYKLFEFGVNGKA